MYLFVKKWFSSFLYILNPKHKSYQVIQPSCVFECYSDEMEVGVLFYKVYKHLSNMHANEVPPDDRGFSFSRKASSDLQQGSRMYRILAQGKPFVWVVKQRAVYLGLLDWQCPLSKQRFSCHRLKKGTNLHVINPTSSPGSSWKGLLSFSTSFVSFFSVMCHITAFSQVH